MTEKKKRFEPSKFVTDDSAAKEEWHNMRRYEKIECGVDSVTIGLGYYLPCIHSCAQSVYHKTTSDPPVIMRARANDPGGVATAIRKGSPINVSVI